MDYIYSIEYSCYTSRMHILLNKKPISRSSTIMQYLNESFEVWFYLLPDLLYREIGEPYGIIYTGTYGEAQLLEKVFKKSVHCIEFKYCRPLIDAPMQERLSELNDILVKYKVTNYYKIKRNAVFYGSNSLLEKYRWHIEQLDVKNRFCEIRFIASALEKKFPAENNSIVFVLCSSYDEIAITPVVKTNACPIIAMIDGQKSFDVEKNIILQGFDGNSFFDEVFKHLLMFPLPECFRAICNSLIQTCDDDRVIKTIRKLMATKNIIEISTDSKVELGSSIPIKASSSISNLPIPRLDFQYQIPGVVECTQQRIYGRKPGTTKVLVFESGGAEAIAELNITVFSRNRITELILSDGSLVLGEGDNHSLSVDHLPVDADNESAIRWTSDDENVAKVSANGTIKAIHKGKCHIFCSAELISASCLVVVKEYAKKLDVKAPVSEDGYIHMLPGDNIELVIKVSPDDSIDHSIQIACDNMLAVNVIGHTLSAVDYGEAQIIVENCSGHLRQTFNVIVEKKIKKQKRGLFR